VEEWKEGFRLKLESKEGFGLKIESEEEAK